MRAGSLLGLLVSPALLAQAQPTFYAAWQDGQDAERRSDWIAAAAAYRRAIELRPAPSARVVIYGNNLLLGYYPYTRLARCEAELGRRDQALALLAQAGARNEPAPEREALQRRLEQPAPRPAPPPLPAPTSALSQAPPLASPSAAEPEPIATTPSPSPAARTAAPAPALPTAVPGAKAGSSSSPPRPAPPAALRVGPAPEPPALPSAVVPPARPPETRRFGWIPLLLIGASALASGGLWVLLGKRRGAPDQGFRDPDQLGPYRIERLLGRGGFASTYLARHEAKGTPVALKVLHPYRQDDAEFLSRFRQEARLGALLDHPNIVRLLDPGPEEGPPYLVMEYLSGQRLDQALRGEGPLPLPDLIGLAQEIAAGMAYAHTHGVVHRDLKPGNIMLVGGHAKIMDFGISRSMDSETLTTTYAFLGTPLYAAPEAQAKTQVGPAADRYSFGVLLFELLAGRPPFQGETPFEILNQHRGAFPPDLRSLRPEVPPALARLVARLLDKEPDQRPEDGEILNVLAGVADPRTSPVAPPRN